MHECLPFPNWTGLSHYVGVNSVNIANVAVKGVDDYRVVVID
jgi:hypothetical protein